METRIPFSNGSEYECWREHNCEKCAKDYDERRAYGGKGCDIEESLSMAGDNMDGKIDVKLLDRAGLDKDHWKRPIQRCHEFSDRLPNTTNQAPSAPTPIGQQSPDKKE